VTAPAVLPAMVTALPTKAMTSAEMTAPARRAVSMVWVRPA
jgi:hypothetical protein